MDPFVLLQLDEVLFLSAEAELVDPLRPGIFRGPEPVEEAEAEAEADAEEAETVGRLVSDPLPALSCLFRSFVVRRWASS